MLQIKKATRRACKLRLGLTGPSGSGKTMSALKLAYGLIKDWSKILVIDTEQESSALYSHLGGFDLLGLDAPYTPEKYIEALRMAVEANYEVIIIDSISHEWEGTGGCLEIHANRAARPGANSYTEWNHVTPRHKRFLQAIVSAPAHVICCGRMKSDIEIQKVTNSHGKEVSTPVKVGTKTITREGFDYEMTLCLDLAMNHEATSNKDRTNLFDGLDPFVINDKTGETLLEWLKGDAPASEADIKERQKLWDEATGELAPLKREIARLLTENNPGQEGVVLQRLTGLPSLVHENDIEKLKSAKEIIIRHYQADAA
jgi:hypothetical protein